MIAWIRDWWRGRYIAPRLSVGSHSVSMETGRRIRPLPVRIGKGCVRLLRTHWHWLATVLALGLGILTYCRP